MVDDEIIFFMMREQKDKYTYKDNSQPEYFVINAICY